MLFYGNLPHFGCGHEISSHANSLLFPDRLTTPRALD
jgi:hypothetical protein